jgi:exo-1,4-beta-D-glucosaminidase
MNSITRRAFIESVGAVALTNAAPGTIRPAEDYAQPMDLALKEGWWLQSSRVVSGSGEAISRPGFQPTDWYKTEVPRTVLSALVRNGVYPDPRWGLNTYRIPDSSDEFNRKFDLAKYSHLPDKRNPWRDPYWYRTEFTVPETMRGERLCLIFKGINYRADVWLNGRQLANRETMVGMYQRFFLDGGVAQPGRNGVAVKVYPVDHPGTPGSQLTPLGTPRDFMKSDIMKDVTYTMSLGYDSMLPQPDRDMGLWQGVTAHFTGPVDIRNPFVVTDLPLPETHPAYLTISAELVNATASSQAGLLRGTIPAANITFEKPINLQPHETSAVTFSPREFAQLTLSQPRLWWPAGMGEQPLYELHLEFITGRETSSGLTTAFGIRKITKKLYIHDKWPGLRIYVNGQKVLSRGGWIQADLLLDWDDQRTEAEVRYFTQANLNTVTNEDLPMLPDEFYDACDRHGVMYWNCFYSSLWTSPTASWEELTNWAQTFENPYTMAYAKALPADRYTNYPLDHDLLERCTVDILKRYRHHPSLIMYSCMGEGMPGRDVYERWHKRVMALDGTRLVVTTPDLKYRLPWLDQEWPSGLDDAGATVIEELKDYYTCVRAGGQWMFSTEIPFLASMPPVESLQKFIPDLWETEPSATYPLNATWAHHGSHSYFRRYDSFIRRVYGEPQSVEDYCMKGHLVTAEHHRAVSEALNHRMWDITSGTMEWKVNSSSPDVQWQIYDWYLRPMVSLYYYRLAFEPLHLQYSYLDRVITIVNHTLESCTGLEAHAQVYSSEGKLLWEKRAAVNAAANTYGDLFEIPVIGGVTPVYFLRLVLGDNGGKAVSRNFYWLSSAASADCRELANLPAVPLEITDTTERKGPEAITNVTVRNASERIAFFIHTAVLHPDTGEEILPVWWDDNYFSLVPGETRTVSATYAGSALKGETPVIDVGGWNVLSPFECSKVRVSHNEVKTGELFQVTATLERTSLDGSVVQLLVDNRPVASKRVWARGGRAREATIQIWLDTAGPHTLKIGNQEASVSVVA